MYSQATNKALQSASMATYPEPAEFGTPFTSLKDYSCFSGISAHQKIILWLMLV